MQQPPQKYAPEDTINKRVVHILLECILVLLACSYTADYISLDADIGTAVTI